MAKYRVIKELNFSPAYKKYEPKVGDVIDLIENPVYTFAIAVFIMYSIFKK